MEHVPLFGSWLRSRRKTLDLTQKALARQVGCSPATIRKIEAEQRRPSRAVAQRLAVAVEVPEEETAAFVAFARRGWRDEALTVGPRGVGILPQPWSRQVRALTESRLLEVREEQRPLFVAREVELANLERHLRDAYAGRGGVAFVTGEPGSGKSALMAEFARRAAERHPGLLVVGGTCNAFAGGGDPYLPFRDLLEGLVGDVERQRAVGASGGVSMDRLAEASAVTLPALMEEGSDLVEAFVNSAAVVRRAAWAGAKRGATLARLDFLRSSRQSANSELAQRQLFDQYARVLSRVSASHSLLLLIDDLQWADDGSVALLFHLARRLEGSRVLMVGAYRPSDVAQGRAPEGSRGPHPLQSVVNELSRYRGEIRVDLDRIAPEEGHRFVEALLDNEPNTLPERFRTALFRRTEGHPLFAVELLRDMQVRGDLVLDDRGRWREGPTLDWQTLPARVEAVIAQRVDRLDDQLREILRVASVEGEEFSVEVAAALLGVDELALHTALAQKLDRRHGLVCEIEESDVFGRRRARYRFAHALFRQYLYDGLSAGERRLLHAGVAQALTEMFCEAEDEIAVQLAHHWAEAGDDEKALHYLVRAGQRAHRLAALDDAARLYRAALERWPRGDDAGRAHTLRQLAECLWLSGNLGDALRTCEKCRLAFESVGDRAAVGMIQRQMGRLYWEQGDRQRSFEHYRAALALLEEGPATAELGRAVSSISQMHMLAGEFEEAIAWGRRALELAEQLHDDGVRVHALCNLGVSEVTIGEKERGIAMMRESAQRAVELGLSHDACRAMFCLGEDLIWLCRYDEARAELEELLAFSKRMHVGIFIDAAKIRLAELDWLQGNWEAALERTSELLDEWGPQRPEGHVELLAATWLGGRDNDLGMPGRARDELTASLVTVRRSDEQQTSVPHAGERLRAAVELGDEPAAGKAVSEILEWGEGQEHLHPYRTALPLLFACQWAAVMGEVAEASRALRLLERLDSQVSTAETGATLSEARGAMALAEGEARVQAVDRQQVGRSEAVGHLQDAVGRWRELGRPLDAVRAVRTLAEASGGGGASAESLPFVESALGEVDRLAGQLRDPQARNAFLTSTLVADLRSRYYRIRARTHASPVSPGVEARLPLPPTPLIGREHDVAEVQRLLATDAVRLVTLLGPPGIGKTRLGIEVGQRLREEFSGAVYYVPLAAIEDPALVGPAVAQEIGLRMDDGLPIEAALAHTLGRRRALFLLDNFEQVGEAAPLVGRLLAACPSLSVLVTSRAALGIYGEHQYEVPPLRVPEPVAAPASADPLSYAAVRLFADRARAACSTFVLTPGNAAAVGEICARLDGIPLALELAASRMKLFSPEGLLARLTSRFELLTEGATDMPPRQRTLRNALEWSHDLLQSGERRLFRRLAVFHGGFTAELAQSVCGVDGDHVARGSWAGASFAELTSLLDQSLLRRLGEQQAVPRFGMLETIWAYAGEKLRESGEQGVVERRHARSFLELAETAEPKLQGGDQKSWLERLDAERDNLRSAVRWAVESGERELALRLVGSLQSFWSKRGHHQEGWGWLERVLEEEADDTGLESARAKALLAGANLAEKLGQLEHARRYAAESLRLHRDLGDAAGEAGTLNALSNIAFKQDDLARSHSLLEACLELRRRLDDRWGIACALHNIGVNRFYGREYGAAETHFRESLAMFHAADDRRSAAWSLEMLAWIHHRLGDQVQARACFEEALAIAAEMGDRQFLVPVLLGLAGIATAEGDAVEGAKLVASSESVRQAMGISRDPICEESYRWTVAAISERLQPEALAAAMSAGGEHAEEWLRVG